MSFDKDAAREALAQEKNTLTALTNQLNAILIVVRQIPLHWNGNDWLLVLDESKPLDWPGKLGRLLEAMEEQP